MYVVRFLLCVCVCVCIFTKKLGTLCQLVVFPWFCHFYIYVQVFTYRERERERKYNKVQACFVLETFYSKFSPLKVLSRPAPVGLTDSYLKKFPIQNMLGLYYTYSTWHHTQSFLHSEVPRGHREPCFYLYIYRYVWCDDHKCWLKIQCLPF